MQQSKGNCLLVVMVLCTNVQMKRKSKDNNAKEKRQQMQRKAKEESEEKEKRQQWIDRKMAESKGEDSLRNMEDEEADLDELLSRYRQTQAEIARQFSLYGTLTDADKYLIASDIRRAREKWPERKSYQRRYFPELSHKLSEDRLFVMGILVIIWYLSTSLEIKVLSLMMASGFSVIEYGFYLLTDDKGKTTVQQWVANALYLPYGHTHTHIHREKDTPTDINPHTLAQGCYR